MRPASKELFDSRNIASSAGGLHRSLVLHRLDREQGQLALTEIELSAQQQPWRQILSA